MTKLAVRHLLLLAVFSIICTSRVFSQTITIGTVDPGPYVSGSTIAVPFHIDNGTSFIDQTNTFTLVMSDAAGNFTPGTNVATLTNTFYATYFNFTLPGGTAAGAYKFMIKASNPAITSAASTPITVVALGAAPVAGASDGFPPINASFPDVFGNCSNPSSSNVFWQNQSTGTANTISFFNESTQAYQGLPNQPLTITSFTPQQTNYTVTVKSVSVGGIVSTKAYQYINNRVALSIPAVGNLTFCLNGGSAPASFPVDNTSASGLQFNYPGDLYTFTWGDGTASSTFTLAQLVALGGATHSYTTASCGKVGTIRNNVFDVAARASNKYCGSIGPTPSVPVDIVINPTNFFLGPVSGIACTNTAVTFTNGSIPGPDPNATAATCQNDPNARYNWLVDGAPVTGSTNLTLNQSFTYTFTTNGVHTITLQAATNNGCQAVDYAANICIENPPTAAFTLPAGPVCSTSPVTPVNTSTVDGGCQVPTYAWTISPNTYTLAGGSVLNSSTPPTINFNNAGRYTVSLTITPATCQPSTVSHTIDIDTPPTVTIPASATLCGTTQTLTFDNTVGSSTRVTYAGSAPASTVTYSWSVTPPAGGSFSFTGGTSATSQYPKIQFTGVGTYAVSIIASNSCGPSTIQTENITLQQAPTLSAGSPQTICQGSAVNLTAVVTNGTLVSQRWTSPTNGSGSAFADRNALVTTYTPTANDILNGTVTLTITGQTGLVGACATVADQITITIVPTDHITSTAAKTICSGDNVNYSITASDGASTYNWTAAVTTGAATGFSASGTSATISDVITNSNPLADAVITYTITPTASAGGCIGTPFTFTVTIPAVPTITPTVANALICSSSQTGISFSSNKTGTKYTWNVSMPAGVTGGHNVTTQTNSSSITDVLVNSTTANATVTYTVTAYNSNGCAGTPFSVPVDVAPAPTVSNAGTDQTLCGATTTTLAGNNPAAGTGKWTVISGTGTTFTDDTSPTSTVTGLTVGSSYRFQWTITTATGCSSSSIVNISVTPATVAGTTAAVGPATVCAPTNTGQIQLTGQTGSILRWESSTDGGSTWQTIAVTSATLSYSNLIQTTQYHAIVQNGTCAIETSNATTITVNQPPPTANAGANQTICASTVAVLNGSDPLTFAGVWTQTSGPAATISNPSNRTTTVTGLSGGNNYTFVWTVQGTSPCTNNQAQMTITDNAATVAGTTTAAGSSTVCAGSNSGQINLTGQVGNVIRWESSINNGVSWQTVANTTAALNYSNLSQTTQYRAAVQNGNCNVEFSNATVITVNTSPPSANAGPNQSLCDAANATLAANNPGTYTGVWTQTAGPAATIADVNNPNTTISGLTGGNTYTFVWTIQASAPCTNTQSQVNIVNAPASVGGTTSTGGATSVCSGSNSGQINVSGQVGNIVRWESSTDGGSTWQPLANTTASIAFSNITQTTQYRAVVQSGPCSTATATVTTITVNQSPPAASAGADQTVCDQTTVTLTANNPGTFSGAWTQTAGPAVSITSPASFQTTVTGLTGGNNYTFTWTILASAPCVNTTAQVNIINTAASVGGNTAAVGPSTICAGTNSGQITLSGQLGTILNWQLSTDGGNTWQTIVNATSTISFSNLTQTTQYRAVVQNGTCTLANSSATTITVNQPPPASNAGADQILCGVTTTNLSANNPGTYTGAWTQVSGSAVTIVNPNNFQTAINGLTDGNTYTFIWTIDGQTPCVNSQSQVNITVTPQTVGGSTASANGTAVCSGTNSGQINLTGQVGNVLRWESSTDNGTTWAPIANNNINITFTNLTQTTQYRAVVQSGTCSILMSSVTNITVNPPAPIADAGPNQILCNATTTTLAAATTGVFTGVWQQTSGPAVTFANPNDPKTTISGLVGGNTYTFSWTVLAQAPCTNTQSQVTITDNPDVVASYTFTPKVGCGNLTVQFSNTSNNQIGANFLWDFGDGSSSTSVSPQHTFAQRTDGRDTVYKFSLSIPGNCIQRAPLLDSVLVRPAVPLAQILPVNTNGCGNFTIDVRNVSPGNNISYDFYLYDGSTLVQKISKTDKSNAVFNPISTTARKTFTLYMIATGYCSNVGETLHIPITISPSTVVAQMFVDNNINSGCVPLTVSFQNNSFGGDTFHYNIYDSNNKVLEQPIAGLAALPYTFSTAGTYYVTITATNSCGTQESSRIQMTVNPLPTPAFAANDTIGCKEVTVTFINKTASNDVNTPASSLSYDWDFGDGTAHSAAFQPTHTYYSAGSPYTVTLTVTNLATGCSNITNRVDYIQVEAPPGTAFIAQPDSIVSIPNYHFSFVDKTTGSPVSWKWTFSDGQTSTLRNPQITFADTGKYKVTLTTRNKNGCDSTISHTVQITGVPGQLYLPNAFIPSSATDELKTFRAKGSGIKTWHLQIFNGYGALIWETTRLDEKGEPVDTWDGTFKGVPVPQGVYVWQASATFINGTEWKGMSYDSSLPKRVGSIHLLR